jgi:GT2 family glycosyltransferase
MAFTDFSTCPARPFVDGKFLGIGDQRFLVKGVSYGTFAPRADDGVQFPPVERVASDFAAMRAAGINTVRLYTAPTADMLDEAARHGLRLMIGLPWTQHVAFLDDRSLRRSIRRDIAEQVRRLSDHPAALLFAIGNEIPPGVVRWHGHQAIEKFLRDLYDEAKSAAPDALLTYVNYPPTEFLELPFFDVCSFNVYLHDEKDLRAYLARLQHIAGNKPLLLAEAGADSIREGLQGQARLTAMQLRAAFESGACGAVAYAWTDEWWRGGCAVEDWAFGLVDAERRPKPALEAVSRVFASAPFDERDRARWPRVSVVVCAYNAEDTIDECLSSLERLTYPDYEVIVVNDGSRDRTADIVSRYPRVRLIDVPNGGLSLARNIGMRAATGEIVAYLDADAAADPQWLDFLVQPIIRRGLAGSGGPNVVPRHDSWVAQCVARAPGGPTHVLLTDEIAEHVPGCNMAYRRDALLAVDGFNPIYLRAGDDVDLCWRIQQHCGPIGFAPSALVWHRHRASIRAYWRQQVGYGEGEEWLRPYHPDKFVGRHVRWRGLVYSPLPFVRSMSGRVINAGVWGSKAFPCVYRVGRHALTYLPHAAEWQIASFALLVVGLALAATGLTFAGAAVAAIGVAGLGTTIVRCIAHALASDLTGVPPVEGLPRWASPVVYRSVIAWLHVVQPLARMSGRLRGVRDWPFEASPVAVSGAKTMSDVLQIMTLNRIDHRFWSESWIDCRTLLSRLVERLRVTRIAREITVDDGWSTHRDLSVTVAPGVTIDVRTLVEEHAKGRCLFRSRFKLRGRWLLALLAAVALATATAAVTAKPAAATGLLTSSILSGAVLIGMVSRVTDRVHVLRDALTRVTTQSGLLDLQPQQQPAPVRAARRWPVENAAPAAVDMVQETR